MTFQDWVSKVANKGIERQAVSGALNLVRLTHFGAR
jgi:hypothetical protein